MKRRLGIGAAAGLAICCAHGASAQELGARTQLEKEKQPAVASETQQSPEEIIVTAQRRAENVQDVPISVLAFDGDILTNANIESVGDLPRIAPGLQFDTGLQAAKARLAIRGVGSAGGTAIEPSVATFIDGFYIPREGATLGAYVDLDSVEVLRGPQGTLFGRNASVGALSLRSALPSNEFSGHVDVEAGTGERYRSEAVINIPASENAAFRLVGYGESFEGLYRNELDGRRVGGTDSFGGRLTGLFALTPELELVVRANYGEQGGNHVFSNFALLPDSFPAGQLPVYVGRFAAAGSPQIDLEPFDRKLNQYIGDDLEDRQWGINGTLTLDMPSGFSLRLLSNYLDWKSDQVGTGLLSATIPTVSQIVGWESKSHTHELQIISPTDQLLNGRLDFVGGLYYLSESFRSSESFQFQRGFCDIVLTGTAFFGPCVAGVQNTAFDQNYPQSTRSFAVYSQATYAITDEVDLVLGARWTTEEKTARIHQVVNSAPGALLATNEDRAFRLEANRPTWRANLTWHPTDNLMLFGSFSTGYKSGGFNSQSAPAVVVGGVPSLIDRVLRPETVNSYEVGMKSDWLGRALQFNATLFRMDVRNFQDRAFNGVSFSLQNAGDIRNQGLELEVVARASQQLRFNFAMAYLDSEFTDYPLGANLPGLPGTQDLTGTRPAFTPEFSGTLGGEYHAPIGDSGMSLLLRTDLTYVSDNPVRVINDNNPQGIQDAFELLSARATLFGRDDRWSVSVFADNILDHGYCTSLAPQTFGGFVGGVANGQTALRCATVAPPRTVGVNAGIHF